MCENLGGPLPPAANAHGLGAVPEELGMRPHPLANFLGKIWANLSKIWINLVKF